MAATLFSPLALGPFTLPNRIAIAPMCMYSALDGTPGDWHLAHWTSLAVSGAAMITVEATGVEARGRITPSCLGLYSDENEAAIRDRLASARAVAAEGAVFGIQLAHAGRKASTNVPWQGGGPLAAADGAWQTVAPSAVPFAPGWHVPHALEADEIEGIVEAFVAAGLRAERAGFDFVEIHGAHGYLLHQFLSPFSNRRTDEWGGPLENRMRLILAIAERLRAALPERMVVGVRLSASEWVEGGFDPDETVAVVKALKARGVAYACISSGGNLPKAPVPNAPLYQVPFAEKVRRETGMITRAVGLIDRPEQAEAIVAEGRADLVAFARAVLADPRWPWRAAAELGAALEVVPQYRRSLPVMAGWAQRG
ncbi:NADH:flavin oxidoreductase/NADH oxidase [Prosthecomicrobium pneumaticum]|uniref:2,4-dienoyl-CoA reductase-like NADH-dependent reductase (Old Yellow Enzyme family) n=1 Tax=Prosthecomicrobium pneumaticum TaxID=81895 RepID=A0A7W9FNE3_9HYPH|nr:NADH:flavin oxidoreductase/NADH oxidase [Prosthecomicrobium pneumaticum]MBB5753904.1 2,4-dienoyl-CoA reductase-like NADH-dependent reductase (Old Yellow Enzyme family) [Prosthecomicrobium pneumaticum]